MTDDTTAQATAEGYLDEILAAEQGLDHAAFVKRFEKQDIEEFGESRFRKAMYAIREDRGEYRSREYLGSLKGFEDADHPDKHPGCVRHVWRGVFEKNETLIAIGLHERGGTVYVNECMYYN